MNIQQTKLQPLALSSVCVNDAYLVNALMKEADYLASLEEGRLLAGFYENAGIRTSFVRYGGWESGLIGGHTLGHYLTAIAQMSAHPALPKERRAFFLERCRRMTDALADCQKTAGSGFLWGAPLIAGGPEAQFDNVERDKLNIMTEAWVPWYTMHKILQGIIDIYRFTEYAPALDTAKRLGDWVCRRVLPWDEAMKHKVLAVEYGGMNDADLEALGTGALRRAVQEGDNEHGCFLSGQIAAMVKKEQPAADIVREVMEEAEPILRRAQTWVE